MTTYTLLIYDKGGKLTQSVKLRTCIASHQSYNYQYVIIFQRYQTKFLTIILIILRINVFVHLVHVMISLKSVCI